MGADAYGPHGLWWHALGGPQTTCAGRNEEMMTKRRTAAVCQSLRLQLSSWIVGAWARVAQVVVGARDTLLVCGHSSRDPSANRVPWLNSCLNLVVLECFCMGVVYGALPCLSIAVCMGVRRAHTRDLVYLSGTPLHKCRYFFHPTYRSQRESACRVLKVGSGPRSVTFVAA